MEELNSRIFKASQRLDGENMFKEDEEWRNVNIAMKPPLIEKIDYWVEATSYSSRSKLVRDILAGKLSEWETRHEENSP